MMLIITTVCLLKTLNRYTRLDGTLGSVNYVQPYVLLILEKNLHDMTHFRRCWLFPGWFQVVSVVSWLASDNSCMVLYGFRWFQVVPGRS